MKWFLLIGVCICFALLPYTYINSADHDMRMSCNECNANATDIAGRPITISFPPSFIYNAGSIPVYDNDIAAEQHENILTPLDGYSHNNEVDDFPMFVGNIHFDDSTQLEDLIAEIKRCMIWICDFCAVRIAQAIYDIYFK
jgi:hypothetical protein